VLHLPQTFIMQQLMLNVSRWALALVFLVILAGSVVRMTGSGMGCPDWPKCFGHFIPPTDAEQLIWSPNTIFSKGQMIIVDEQLFVAREKFVSGNEFNAELWRIYDKHDYAIFNPLHTWVEYINRLLGALSGIPVLILFILSLIGISKRPVIFALSLFSLFALGFVAWLGKVVVDGNLIPHSITYHMFGAIAVVLPLLAIGFLLKEEPVQSNLPDKYKWLATFVLVLSLVQIYLGTAVREQVDHLYLVEPRENWIDQLDYYFLIHRSFSIIILAANGWFIWLIHRFGWKHRLFNLLAVLLAIEILAGVALNYFGFPAAAQPVHIVCAFGIVAVQFYLMLWVWRDGGKLLPAS
jgi:heme a synthase